MSDVKKPFLSVVRDGDPALEEPAKTAASPAGDAAADTLPPVPAPVPESAHHSALRRRVVEWDAALGAASRLAAVGTVLAQGASELRPCMSAESAKAWVRRHADNIDRAGREAFDDDAKYVEMPDLREAVLGAAAELDEAGANSPALVSALYGVVKKYEVVELAPTVVASELRTGWLSGVMETYGLGLDALGAIWL